MGGGSEGHVDVTWEDQRDINAFGKLNDDLNVVKAHIQLHKTDLEALEEAQNELMLVDDEDAARYLFGECFVHTATDDADSRIETEMERLRKASQDKESRQTELTEQLASLKQKLYAKFGNQINLDDD